MSKKYAPVESVRCPNCQIELIEFLNQEYSIRKRLSAQERVNEPESVRPDPGRQWVKDQAYGDKSGSVTHTQDGSPDFETLNYRPSLFAFPKEWVFITAALFGFMFPLTVISLFISEHNLGSLTDYPWLVSGMQGLFFIFGFFLLFTVLTGFARSRIHLEAEER